MNTIEFIESKSYADKGEIRQIPVINNRIINIDNRWGVLYQLVAIPAHCYLTGNSEVSFFECGSKYLWNNLFYHSNRSYNIRLDDYSITNITNLTGEIKYNSLDISAVYSPYYNQYNISNLDIPETLCTQFKYLQKSTLTHQPIITDELYSNVINNRIKTGNYDIVFAIYTDLAYERRRHAVIAMNI